MSNEEKSMPPSCKACTFFCENETEENCGYCLAFDGDIKGEGLKIKHDDHEEVAKNCCRFFRRVKDLNATQAAVIALRTNLYLQKVAFRSQRISICIAVLAAIIAAISLFK